EVKGIEVAGKYRDVSRAEISHRRRAMLQFRETKERGGGGTQRQLDGAVAFFDLVPGELIRHLLAIEVGMRPGVGANRMPGSRHLPEDLRMISGVLADRKKHRLGAFVRQRLEHCRGMARPRAIIECQHDFPVGEKVELLEMLEAESGSARGVQ